jgi:hypothetical protein
LGKEQDLIRNLEDIINKIDKEMTSLEEEKENLQSSVQKDLEVLINEYFNKKLNSANVESFKNKHFNLLKDKKEEALVQAIKKLKNLKSEIEVALAH